VIVHKMYLLVSPLLLRVIPTSQTTLSVSVTSVNANILCEYEAPVQI